MVCNAYDSVIEWSNNTSEIPDVNESGWWVRSDSIPDRRDTRVIYVSHPFNEEVGESFWTLFLPANASINGWGDFPDEIEKSAFIKAKINKVLEYRDHYAWLEVEVEDKLLINDLKNKFTPVNEVHTIFDNIYDFDDYHLYEYDRWLYYYGTDQGDLSNWMLIEKNGKYTHLIALGESGLHYSTAYFGNILLSESTYKKIINKCDN
ncbi:hypothetical protein B9G39_25950 [Zooshikella ganghwensis]|uniref:Uncharacterized protein n=1 Tax=Zooshikella ganghwensis TaxID=202772 RepID=A0A4P9VFI8_9GAMM|nr:hypothetical protein B9G39_25950 [Zooshikella ganghwensis]